jgi:hypothetical protein
MRLGAAKTANAGSAAHRKSDQGRDDPCAAGLRKGASSVWQAEPLAASSRG